MPTETILLWQSNSYPEHATQESTLYCVLIKSCSQNTNQPWEGRKRTTNGPHQPIGSVVVVRSGCCKLAPIRPAASALPQPPGLLIIQLRRILGHKQTPKLPNETISTFGLQHYHVPIVTSVWVVRSPCLYDPELHHAVPVSVK